MNSSRSESRSPADAADESVARVAAATLSSIGEQASLTADAAIDLGRAAVKLADRQVRERPWKAAMVAASIGLLAGLLLGRR